MPGVNDDAQTLRLRALERRVLALEVHEAERITADIADENDRARRDQGAPSDDMTVLVTLSRLRDLYVLANQGYEDVGVKAMGDVAHAVQQLFDDLNLPRPHIHRSPLPGYSAPR